MYEDEETFRRNASKMSKVVDYCRNTIVRYLREQEKEINKNNASYITENEKTLLKELYVTSNGNAT